MRDKVDTREIVLDMRREGLHGVVSMKNLTEYTGRGKDWIRAHFGDVGGGISIVSAARILGGLANDAQ